MAILEQFESLRKPSPNSFLSRLTQDTWVLSSLPHIIEKLEDEGYLNVLLQSLRAVIANEVVTTTDRINQLDPSQLDLDLETMLAKNLMIFKENLKVITGYMSNLKSRTTM